MEKEILKNPNIYNSKLYDIIDVIVKNENKLVDIIYDIIDYKTSIATKKKEYKENLNLKDSNNSNSISNINRNKK